MASVALGTALRQIHRLFSEGTVTALPDDQLLARFVADRDEVSFEALVARHGPMVLAVCRSILRDEHAAEDAFQATFLVFARKAGSLWTRDTLGGWLHRVAYRIALRADAEGRVRREKEAAVVRFERDGTWDDWIPVLHEEIDRMPEAYRSPIVLCDLQELTYEQAAQQLRWTVPTLRCRLAKARERLRGRLTRRGLTGAGATLGGLLGSARVKGAVPLASIQAASSLAVNGGATGTISALAAVMLKGMRLARVKAVAGLTLAVGAVAACVGSLGLGQADDPPPKPIPPVATNPPDRARAAGTPAGNEEGERLDYHGRVISPEGRPVSNAKLFVFGSIDENESRPPRATTGPNGRFAFSISSAKFRDPTHIPYLRVTALAPGFGFGTTDSEDPDAGHDLTIRLTEDLPIEGRLVDMEGRPVAGASVRVRSISSPLDHDLDPWLAAVKAREANPDSLRNKYLRIFSLIHDNETEAFPGLKTDREGRFRLTGIGRERLANLVVQAPEIRLMKAGVMTRHCDPVQAMKYPEIHFPGSTTYHGASPRLVASPSRPIEGIVRDRQTGQPIAGVKVNSYRFADVKIGNDPSLSSTSDARGHYRIDGMPRGSGNQLTAVSPADEPYLPVLIDVADSPGLGTLPHDIELVRGTWIEGRITDLLTDRPVSGWVAYHVAADNPNLDKVPGFLRISPFGSAFSATVKNDGTFRIAALPGRGLLTVQAAMRPYPCLGSDEFALQEEYVPKLEQSVYQAAIPIDVPRGADRHRQDVRLDPGLVKEVTCIDPDGKPLKGAIAYGLGSLGEWTEHPHKESTFTVEALRKVDEAGLPGQVRSNRDGKVTWAPRTLLFLHEGRKLVGWLEVRGNEAGPLRVRMEPWGTVSGRAVDPEGNPRVDLTLEIQILKKPRLGGGSIEHRPERIRTDAAGRFRIEGLAPGLAYRAYVQAPSAQEANRTIDVAAAAPGETRDLGDVTITFQDQAD